MNLNIQAELLMKLRVEIDGKTQDTDPGLPQHGGTNQREEGGEIDIKFW